MMKALLGICVSIIFSSPALACSADEGFNQMKAYVKSELKFHGVKAIRFAGGYGCGNSVCDTSFTYFLDGGATEMIGTVTIDLNTCSISGMSTNTLAPVEVIN